MKEVGKEQDKRWKNSWICFRKYCLDHYKWSRNWGLGVGRIIKQWIVVGDRMGRKSQAPSRPSVSVQWLSRVQFFATPWTIQHTRPPCPLPTPRVYSNSCPLSWDAIQPSHPLSSPSPPCLQSLPASGSFPMSQFFTSGGQSIGVSASASVLPMNIQDWSPWDGLVGSPCCLRDSQESYPTPQFKSIHSSALNFLYSPTLASIYDYWKNDSLD